MHNSTSLVPRLLPDFILQPWRKIGRRPGIKTMSRTGHGGPGQYVAWTRFVLTESTISGPWHRFDPRPSPDFSPQLRDKIWEGPGDKATILPLDSTTGCVQLQLISWFPSYTNVELLPQVKTGRCLLTVWVKAWCLIDSCTHNHPNLALPLPVYPAWCQPKGVV